MLPCLLCALCTGPCDVHIKHPHLFLSCKYKKLQPAPLLPLHLIEKLLYNTVITCKISFTHHFPNRENPFYMLLDAEFHWVRSLHSSKTAHFTHLYDWVSLQQVWLIEGVVFVGGWYQVPVIQWTKSSGQVRARSINSGLGLGFDAKNGQKIPNKCQKMP